MDADHPEIRKLDYAQKIDKFLQLAAKSIPDSRLTTELLSKAQVSFYIYFLKLQNNPNLISRLLKLQNNLFRFLKLQNNPFRFLKLQNNPKIPALKFFFEELKYSKFKLSSRQL